MRCGKVENSGISFSRAINHVIVLWITLEVRVASLCISRIVFTERFFINK